MYFLTVLFSGQPCPQDSQPLVAFVYPGEPSSLLFWWSHQELSFKWTNYSKRAQLVFQTKPTSVGAEASSNTPSTPPKVCWSTLIFIFYPIYLIEYPPAKVCSSTQIFMGIWLWWSLLSAPASFFPPPPPEVSSSILIFMGIWLWLLSTSASLLLQTRVESQLCVPLQPRIRNLRMLDLDLENPFKHLYTSSAAIPPSIINYVILIVLLLVTKQ